MEGHINIDNDTNIIDISDKSSNYLNKGKKEETLSSLIENVIKESSLKEYVYLVGDEIVSSQNCQKNLSIEGRVSKELETNLNQLQVKILETIRPRLGSFINMNQFWKVDSGIREGEKFLGLEAFDLNGEKTKIEHEAGTVLIINFWSLWSGSADYFNFLISILKKIEEGKVENVTLDKVKCVAISGEEIFSQWKENAIDEELNKYIPQFINKNIYDIVGIKLAPSLIIIDKNGFIKCLDIFKDINLEETIQSLIQDKEKVVKNSNVIEITESNPNAWWLDMDAESKVDIVRNVNLSLREIGSYSSQFVILTKYKHFNNTVHSHTIPIFMGTMFEAEFEILQNFAVDLQCNMNFNNFLFECKVLG